MVMLSTGDTAWVLIASLLVLLMSIPGVAFFYSGLTKRKNVLNTMFLTFIAFSIASIIWVVYGYPFAFGDASISGLIAEPAHFFMSGIGINDLTGSIPTILFPSLIGLASSPTSYSSRDELITNNIKNIK